MSAESGIPTFPRRPRRPVGPLDPMRLASPKGFRADPGLVWRWYAERRAGVRAAAPNAGPPRAGRFAARHPGG
jgi:NAD-dependent deacetylase